jgi:hypothetical protein
MYCTHCKTDTHNTASCYKTDTHNMASCYKLKTIARDTAEAGKARDKGPYSKRTFRKEVNAIAPRAGKHGDIKIVEKARSLRKRSSASRSSKPSKQKNTRKWRMRKRMLNLTGNRQNPCITWNPGSLVKRKFLLTMFI